VKRLSLGDRWHRMLLSVMGPPQLGPYGDEVVVPPTVSRCSRCGHPDAEHEVVRSPALTYRRCPEG
jgi:hypothetical protein